MKNEAQLRGFISLPGNNRCADCSARNPGKYSVINQFNNSTASDTDYTTGWASWNVRTTKRVQYRLLVPRK